MDILTQYKSSSLNLWDIETKETKLDIDAHKALILFSATGGQYFKFSVVLYLTDDVNGDIVDVAEKLHGIEAGVNSITTNIGTQITTLQTDLSTYKTNNNTLMGTIQSEVYTEVANREAFQLADQQARNQLDTDIRALITDEKNDRTSDINLILNNLSTEANNREITIDDEVIRSQDVEIDINSQIIIERDRLNVILAGVDVDLASFQAIIDQFEALDEANLGSIDAITDRSTDLENRFNTLVEQNNVGVEDDIQSLNGIPIVNRELEFDDAEVDDIIGEFAPPEVAMSTIVLTEDDYQKHVKSGWHYKSSGTDRIQWSFFRQIHTIENKLINQIESFYIVLRLHKRKTSKSIPHIEFFTKPIGTNDADPNYHSKFVYKLNETDQTAKKKRRIIMYFGTNLPYTTRFFRRVKNKYQLELDTDASEGDLAATNIQISKIAISTDVEPEKHVRITLFEVGYIIDDIFKVYTLKSRRK